MNDRPIIFSAPMVPTLLDGRMTQTRRILKPQPVASDFRNTSSETAKWFHDPVRGGMWLAAGVVVGPFATLEPGSRLWVREAFADVGAGATPIIIYRARHNEDKNYGPRGFTVCAFARFWLRARAGLFYVYERLSSSSICSSPPAPAGE